MDHEQLQEQLYDLFAKMSSVPFIWAKQAAPRPSKPYIAIDFITFDARVGLDELRVDGDKFTREGNRFFNLQLDCYGENALQILANIRSSIYLEEFVQLWAQQNMAIVDDSDVRDLSVQIASKWETRGVIDLKISYSSELDENIDYINQAVVNGEIVG